MNKVVFARGFNYPMTVTCAHFTFTVVFYRVMRALKLFEVRLESGQAFASLPRNALLRSRRSVSDDISDDISRLTQPCS